MGLPEIYPASLPVPARWDAVPRERRALSAIPGLPGTRVRGRDRITDAEAEWVYTPEHMAVWRPWYSDDIVLGQKWFVASLPGPGGFVDRLVRFRTETLRLEHAARGIYRVSATMEVRGIAKLACVPWVQIGPVPEESLPVLFGSGVFCARDPATGYVWTTWRSTPVTGSIPIGGSATLLGGYALVYDPQGLTLVDAIQVGTTAPDQMNIVHFRGSMYVGMESTPFTPYPIITKIDAATRVVVGSGYVGQLSAVTKRGLVSHDASGLYISVTNGIGDGTSELDEDSLIADLPGSGNSDWLYNFVFNPFSEVRAYTGYGPFIDLRGAVTMSVDTSAYYTTSANPQSHRIVCKPCSPYIFTMSAGEHSVLRVHTLTGEIQAITTTFWATAMYYSPESERLYVEGAEPRFSTPTVRAYDSNTLELLEEFPDYAIADGRKLGNSLYLGGESFVACESDSAPSSRMWFLSFPH